MHLYIFRHLSRLQGHVYALPLLHIEREGALDRRLESLRGYLDTITADTHRADGPLSAGVALRAVSQAGIDIDYGHRGLGHHGAARIDYAALEGSGVLLRHQRNREEQRDNAEATKKRPLSHVALLSPSVEGKLNWVSLGTRVFVSLTNIAV